MLILPPLERTYCKDCGIGVVCPDYDPPNGWCQSIHAKQVTIKSDSLRSKDMPSGLSALGGGEEEADEDCPSGKPLGNSPNDQDDSPKFYFRTKGGMVEDLDPELRDILKQNLMDIGCLFLDSDTIESAGKKMCIRTGTEPTPSEQQCEGCSFALYGLKIVKSIIKHRKRIQ